MNKEQISADERYQAVQALMIDTFRGDEAALHGIAHGHPVRVAGISGVPEKGAYNLLMPQQGKVAEEIPLIKKAKALVVVCSDRRQSQEVYSEIMTDNSYSSIEVITIAVAAGPSQPEVNNRDQVMGKYIQLLGELNPEINIFLVGHNMRCGGLNLMT